jgi:hypothetical protein
MGDIVPMHGAAFRPRADAELVALLRVYHPERETGLSRRVERYTPIAAELGVGRGALLDFCRRLRLAIQWPKRPNEPQTDGDGGGGAHSRRALAKLATLRAGMS